MTRKVEIIRARSFKTFGSVERKISKQTDVARENTFEYIHNILQKFVVKTSGSFWLHYMGITCLDIYFHEQYIQIKQILEA